MPYWLRVRRGCCANARGQGRGLTDDELTGLCCNLFVGGLDTVSTNMSAHFRHPG